MGETERERRDKHKHTVSYECSDCSILIEGHSDDPQESPWLYCPECDEQMNLAVEWR